jgi:ABC-type Na+ efflux pump permease subunit
MTETKNAASRATFPWWTRILPSFALFSVIEDLATTHWHWSAWTQFGVVLIAMLVFFGLTLLYTWRSKLITYT